MIFVLLKHYTNLYGHLFDEGTLIFIIILLKKKKYIMTNTQLEFSCLSFPRLLLKYDIIVTTFCVSPLNDIVLEIGLNNVLKCSRKH